MRKRYLNAVSIGFEVLQWESADQNLWRGGVATRWEQTELSVVPVPMDANALVTSGRGLADPELLAAVRGCSAVEFDQLLDRLRALDELTVRPDPGRERTTTPTPPASGINQTEARGLLAAFNLRGES
jgi:hypothetical protein